MSPQIFLVCTRSVTLIALPDHSGWSCFTYMYSHPISSIKRLASWRSPETIRKMSTMSRYEGPDQSPGNRTKALMQKDSHQRSFEPEVGRGAPLSYSHTPALLALSLCPPRNKHQHRLTRSSLARKPIQTLSIQSVK